MNKLLVGAFILSLTLKTSFSYSQENYFKEIKPEDIKGEWIKDKITLADGSTIYDPSTTQSSYILNFINADSLLIGFNGVNSIHRYKIVNGVIEFMGTHLQITSLEKPIMELTQVKMQADIVPIKIKMIFKPTYDLTVSPEYYLAKNGEKVYKRFGDIVNPKFINSQQSAMDYIYTNFAYPEYKKGGFVVRFIITKTGEIEGLRVIASSNQKYDDKLIKAVLKTKGKWKPANYGGEKVNCEVEFNYNLGWTEETTTKDQQLLDKSQASEFANYGDYYFDERNYKSAIYYFTKAIEKDPFQVDALYKRAASYVMVKKIDDACGDYFQLKLLNQVKATELYDNYCKEYTPKTP